MKTKQKETWKAPKLTVYGKVSEITKQTVKHFGASDGFVANDQPIGSG